MASSTSSAKQLHRIELFIALISDDKNFFIALMMDFTSDKGKLKFVDTTFIIYYVTIRTIP